jgi:hypothetical protein
MANKYGKWQPKYGSRNVKIGTYNKKDFLSFESQALKRGPSFLAMNKAWLSYLRVVAFGLLFWTKPRPRPPHLSIEFLNHRTKNWSRHHCYKKISFLLHFLDALDERVSSFHECEFWYFYLLFLPYMYVLLEVKKTHDEKKSGQFTVPVSFDQSLTFFLFCVRERAVKKINVQSSSSFQLEAGTSN